MKNMFDKMINSLSSMTEEKMMDECMSDNPRIAKSIPTRYRIIAMGFLSGLSIHELNDTLEDAGCERLYSRNYKEAGLIYAFVHGLSYKEWKEMSIKSDAYIDTVLERKIYSGRRFTLQDLKAYVESTSDRDIDQLYTRAMTVMLNQQLLTTSSEDAFYQFLSNNKETFSKVREKARYYFCKYLLSYLEYHVNLAIEEEDPAIASLLKFDIRKLKGASREMFHEFPITMSGIYDAFNYHYFSYMDTDWMDVLIDYYGDIESLPAAEKSQLAASLRKYQPDWAGLSDEAILQAKLKEMEENEQRLDELYVSGTLDSQVRSRSGENMIRQFINGEADIDRTSLLCYLLFFGSILNKDDPLFLSLDRLDHILDQCGFGMLKTENEFDEFILGYISSDDPIDYLMNTVTAYAQQEKNFYLYHMYYKTYSNSKLFEKYIDK